MPSINDLNIGDKVQVIPGTTDRSLFGNTGTRIATRYTTDGDLYMDITQKGRSGDPNYLVLSYNGTVITATNSDFIGENYISKSKPKADPPPPPKPISTEAPPDPRPRSTRRTDEMETAQYDAPVGKYTTTVNTETWAPSRDQTVASNPEFVQADSTARERVPQSLPYQFPTLNNPNLQATAVNEARKLTPEELASVGTNGILKIEPMQRQIPGSEVNFNDLVNADPSKIQNNEQYPIALPMTDDTLRGFQARKYDYQTQANPTFRSSEKTLRDQLGEFRTLYGIPVHGSSGVARFMKYYLYNRHKIPDKNLAYSRTFTHVFFTKPDLNILTKKAGVAQLSANRQVEQHTHAAMVWRENPDLFKLLVDFKFSNDSNNFNMLLSNQVSSFAINGEQLNSSTHGRTWNNYEVNYGTEYTGREAGEITIGFHDTKFFDVIKLLKLWITYIDNVSRGEWSPTYNRSTGGTGRLIVDEFEASHVYSKTLDYASSIYFIVVAEDGETVLYWSKYYGVYPTSTGAEALSTEFGRLNSTPNLSIPFKYIMKDDMNPISLIEFNYNAGTRSDRVWIPHYNPNEGRITNPYVGTPYIEMEFPDIASSKTKDQTYHMNGQSIDLARKTASIKLRFDPTNMNEGSINYHTMFYESN